MNHGGPTQADGRFLSVAPRNHNNERPHAEEGFDPGVPLQCPRALKLARDGARPLDKNLCPKWLHLLTMYARIL
jgi:hypothetical protein